MQNLLAMLELILLSLLIMAASLSGVVTVWGRAGSFVERNLDYLISFSAGVFLVFLYGLGSEAIEHAGSVANGLFWILAGAVGIWAVFKLLPSAHTHGEDGAGHVHLDPRRLLLTDGIHNAADGIFLAAAYATVPALAATAAISIFVHEALQEVSEFFVLREAGYSTRGALGTNFLVSSTILVGSVGGYFLLGAFEALEGPLLGLAAGGLLVVVLHDLIPHSVRDSISLSHYLAHALSFAVGCALMAGIVASLPHAEPEALHVQPAAELH